MASAQTSHGSHSCLFPAAHIQLWYVFQHSMQPPNFSEKITLAQLPAVPVGVQGVLKTICTQLLEHSHTTYQPTIIIDDSGCEVPAWDIVPLAGLILEYVVAYVPNEQSIAESKFLGGVDLEIYTCVLSWKGTEGPLGGASEHTLLQFSCPSSMAQQTDSITRRIHERFTTRLAFASLDCKLHVSSRTTILDRVAL